ncbi:MAG: hypothetical protein MUC50_23450 [Myxococcota bacterium]|nr:hypothetical protein [Myxococcota bacterium]
MNYSRVYGVLTLVLALGSLGGCENVDDLKDVDMLGDDFQINARAGDMAAPGFPPWVRADLVPGAVPPILKLAPLHGLGDQQTVDGLVNPTIEYANGAQAALSDWYSGMAPGDMHLQLAGQKLLIGIRIAPGDCDPYGCSVFVAIDENRAATLTNHDTPFGPEDRGVVVQWARPSDVTIGQWSGTHALGNLPQSQQWPVVARVGSEPSNGRKSIELEITLGTAAATAQTISNPRAMPFGLAVAVVGNKAPKLSLVSKSPTNSYYVWPNEPHPAGGQWIALPNFPFTYKTIQPDFPTGKTTGILTYNVGMLPFLSNGGDGSPHDFAAYAADPDVQVACLQEVWDHAQRREIAAIANELAKMHAVGLPQTCGGGDESGCDAADLAADLVTSSGITIPDTGLLLLSKSPIADSDIMFYKNSESGCRGADCLEEKGALWARIGTANAKREPKCNSSSSQVTGSITHVPDRYCSPPVYAGEQFIDVFCTHLQASCDEVSTIAKYVDALEAVLTTGGSEILEAVGIDPINMEKFECHGDDDYKNVQKKQLTKLASDRAR